MKKRSILKSILILSIVVLLLSCTSIFALADEADDGTLSEAATDGASDSRFTVIDGNTYCIDPDTGDYITGWILDDNWNVRYFGASSYKMLTGLWELGGYHYFFDEDTGIMQHDCIATAHDGSRYLLDDRGVVLTGWQTDSDGNVRYFGAASYKMLTGLWELGGEQYYFDPDTGIRQTGWQTFGNSSYYFDPETGAARTGWVCDENWNVWYLDESTAQQLTGLHELWGYYYFFDEDTGIMHHTGWHTAHDGSRYYLQNNGVPQEGWLSDDTGTYFISSKTKAAVTGLQVLDGYAYFFDTTTGAMKTGWIDYRGNTYYFDPETGAAQTCWFEDDGKFYFFDWEDFTLYKGLHKLDDNVFYFDDETGALLGGKGPFTTANGDRIYRRGDGALRTGWIKEDGETYYYSTSNGKMYTGLKQIGSHFYYFDEATGAMQSSGWYTTGKGVRCFLFDDGTAATGWLGLDGGVGYLSVETGGLAAGLTQEGIYTYFFDEDTNLMCHDGLHTAKDGSVYYLNDNGAAATGWITVDGNTYYFDPETYRAATGLKQIGYYSYFFDETTGIRLHDCIAAAKDGTRYWLDDYGVPQSGWVTADGKTYCFGASTKKALTGFWQLNDGAYYFGDDGALLTGHAGLYTASDGSVYWLNNDGTANDGWAGDQNGVRFFGYSTGKMLTGLWKLYGYNYYFDPDTGYYIHGWKTAEDGNTYYFLDSGAAATGWWDFGSDRYFFNATTGQMLTGWQALNGSNYYFYTGDDGTDGKKGTLARNTMIDGYTIDGDGKASMSIREAMTRTAQYYSSPTSYLVMTDVCSPAPRATGR